MKIRIFCFPLAIILALSFAELQPAECAGLQRRAALDSLASDIARLGYIPSGGRFIVLAASNGWLTLVSGVRLLPQQSEEFQSALTDTSGMRRFYGSAPFGPGEDAVLITAPSPICRPSGVQLSVEPGDRVVFRIEDIFLLNDPAAALRTPEMEVTGIVPDSSGVFAFTADSPGVYWFEVMHRTAGGPSVALLFPVISGGSAQDILSGEMPVFSSGANTPEEILEEINALRARRGVNPLTRTEELDRAAAARAGRLALAGSWSHFGPETGSLSEELPDTVTVFGENIARGRGYSEAWSMILLSPFHLDACLRPEYRLIGLAGAVDPSDYQWQLVLVQVMTGGNGTI